MGKRVVKIQELRNGVIFDNLEKRISEGLDLVTWYGELYFELHRGTYTTQANNKRNNRKSENMLRDVELLASRAELLKRTVFLVSLAFVTTS
jgi:alpha-mannosidase